MWELKKHTKAEEDSYFNEVFKVIKKKAAGYPQPIKDVFGDKDIMKCLILADPMKMDLLFNVYNRYYAKLITQDTVKEILDYSSIITKATNSGQILAKLKSVRTCPYCNRSYTMTVNKNGGASYNLRADFDHFLNKGENPLFALSLYNLVPSCLNCNRTIKRKLNFNPQTHIHPYIYDAERDNWRFDFRVMGLGKYKIEINIDKPSPKVERTISDLKLEEIYSEAHSDYELTDMINLSMDYPPNYIKNIVIDIMKDTGLSKAEVIRSIFGITQNANDDLSVILNKMRRDIMLKLNLV